MSWLHTHYHSIPNLFHCNETQSTVFFVNRDNTSTSQDIQDIEDWPEIQLPLSVGPWKSIYIKLKEPENDLSEEQKRIIVELREQGNRVQVIRCLEDFKTFIGTYVPYRRLG